MEMAVLGLGVSIQTFRGQEDFSIGVNDIYKYHPADYVLCLDDKKQFTPERLKVIEQCTPKIFYSQQEDWATHPQFQRITLARPRGGLGELDTKRICYYIETPLSATILAYKLGASSIVLYGADYKDHPKIKGDRTLQALKKIYFDLYNLLKQRGVSLKVSSKHSILSDVIPLNY